VVHAERTAAQPGQVGGTHHWNHRSATRCRLCCVVGSYCRCRTTGGRRDEGSGRCSGPASDVFEKHVTMVARSCHYHAQAIRHIRHLLSTELASTVARSLILTKLDYCNSLLHGSHTSSIQTLQRVQNNAARIVLQAPRHCHANSLLRQLHWLPVRHRINYKLAVMTYKIHSTGLPAYLGHHINPRETTRTLRSSDTTVHRTIHQD